MFTDWMKRLPKEMLMADLGVRMSRVSENATRCDWHPDTDEVVPRACYEMVETCEVGQLENHGVGVVDAWLMVAIATELGHWVTMGPRGCWKRYVPEAMKERASRTGHAAALPPTAG
jgi:hypothetical protein